MSHAEMKLLSTIRNPQYQHLVHSLTPDLFTGENVTIIEAMKIAMNKFGVLTTEAIESVLHSVGKNLPPEFDIPVTVDPFPLVYEVQRLAKKRNLQEMSKMLLEASKEYDPNLKGFQEQLEGAGDFIDHDVSTIPGINELLADMAAKENGSYIWLRTGIPFLDAMIGGEWPRGEISIITAKSGGGKTAVAGSSALNMARMYKDHGTSSPVAIFSMEMPKQQLIARFIAQMIGMDSRIIRTGKHLDGRPLSAGDKARINEAIIELQSLPLYIVDAERLSADEIIATARKLMIEKGVQAFFVDYLQLMSYDDSMGKHYGLGDAVKRLKAFVKKHHVAIIMLAQYHETKETIRDATDPEKDCALWTHIEIDFESRDDSGVCPAKITLRKSRFGPLGESAVLYNTRRLTFIADGENT